MQFGKPIERTYFRRQDEMLMAAPGVYWLDDGITGHQRQSIALAHALELGAVQARSFALRQPYQALSPRWLRPNARALASQHQLAPGSIVVSCGRRAAAAAQAYRALNPSLRLIQILDPGGDLGRYDVVVLPAHDRRRHANVVLVQLAIHDLSPERLARARSTAPWPSTPRPLQVFLIGAPSRHVPWSLARLLQTYRSASAQGAILTSVSRRTPSPVRAALQQWHQQHGAYYYDGNGANPYLSMLACADRIYVTADSVNMISEAAASAATLQLIGAEYARAKMRRFLDALSVSGRLADTGFSPIYQLPELAGQIRSKLRRP